MDDIGRKVKARNVGEPVSCHFSKIAPPPSFRQCLPKQTTAAEVAAITFGHPTNQPTNLHLVNLTNSKLFFLPSYGKWEEDVLARVHDRLRFRLFLRPTLLLRAYGKMKGKVN